MEHFLEGIATRRKCPIKKLAHLILNLCVCYKSLNEVIDCALAEVKRNELFHISAELIII